MKKRITKSTTHDQVMLTSATKLAAAALVCVLLCFCGRADAQTTPAPAPNTVSYLAGSLSIGWERSGDLVSFTLSSPLSAGQYMAVAVTPTGASQMSGGKGVACQQPASGATTAQCYTMSLSNYGQTPRSDDTSFALVAAWTTGTHAYVKVRVSASAMGIGDGTTASRVIYAIGAWSAGAVTQHSSTNRGSTSITFGTGAPSSPGTPGATPSPRAFAPFTSPTMAIAVVVAMLALSIGV